MLKCDHCRTEFDREMTVNVCVDGCGVFCDDCIMSLGNRGMCPKCYRKTVPQDELQEPDNIDEKIKDSKGY